MKTKHTMSALVLMMAMTSGQVFAAGSTQHSGAAIDHAVQASGHASVGTVKLASGVVAVPLAVSGAVGTVSGQVATEMMDFANQPIGDPLPISDEVIINTPSPAEAMR